MFRAIAKALAHIFGGIYEAFAWTFNHTIGLLIPHTPSDPVPPEIRTKEAVKKALGDVAARENQRYQSEARAAKIVARCYLLNSPHGLESMKVLQPHNLAWLQRMTKTELRAVIAADPAQLANALRTGKDLKGVRSLEEVFRVPVAAKVQAAARVSSYRSARNPRGSSMSVEEAIQDIESEA